MLHVSTRGEYGVRLMIDLGRHYGQGLRTLNEIAKDEGLLNDEGELMVPYLEQLIKRLRDADLVTSVRGAHGGYQLSRSPDTIRMSEVLRILEGSLAPYSCLTEDSTKVACTWNRIDNCSTQVLWARLRDAIEQVLDATTLADLITTQPLMRLKVQPATVMKPTASA
jgi:Rrf2 family protein